MPASSGLHVALVGLGFGAEFAPIYLHHPAVATLTIVDSNPEILHTVGDRFEIQPAGRLTSLDAVLTTAGIDAVHLTTPIPLHAAQSLAVLRAGKHCASTVPMATTLEDLHALVDAQREAGRVYMGMETAVYTRRFFYARELVETGALGRIQFLRGAHYQDMEAWPSYWLGLPPMHYATHAVAPVLALAKTRARAVRCLGSGVMREELRRQYGNPYPVETAIFELESETPLAAEITRSLFQTARGYSESFNVYGERMSFEWEQIEDEPPVVFRMHTGTLDGHGRKRGTRVDWERIDAPDRGDLLPPEIARFTTRGVYDATIGHQSFKQGGGHGGAHPHLVHEFVSSIVAGRQPFPDARTMAGWSAPGICAHQSALLGGERVEIPSFAEVASRIG